MPERPSEIFARLASEAGIDLTPHDLENLAPYDLAADCNRLWPSFSHEWLSEGDVIELKRDGQPDRRVRVTKVIPGPGGQVMYDTEPVDAA